MRNPTCIYDPSTQEDAPDFDLLARALSDQLTKADHDVAVRFTGKAASKAAEVIRLMDWFFSGPGEGKAYETNAFADAAAPTPEIAAQLKSFLGKSAGFKEFDPYRTKGSPFNCRGRVAYRNVWAAPYALPSVRRNAIRALPTAAQRRLPVAPRLDHEETSVVLDQIKSLRHEVGALAERVKTLEESTDA